MWPQRSTHMAPRVTNTWRGNRAKPGQDRAPPAPPGRRRGRQGVRRVPERWECCCWHHRRGARSRSWKPSRESGARSRWGWRCAGDPETPPRRAAPGQHRAGCPRGVGAIRTRFPLLALPQCLTRGSGHCGSPGWGSQCCGGSSHRFPWQPPGSSRAAR